MRRQVVSIAIVLFFCAPLCPVASQAQDPAADSTAEVPRIIIFTSGRWYFVDMLEEKNGSYIYSKPGGSPIAVTAYDFERARTLEVNGALRDLVAACRGEAQDLSRIFALKGRSKEVFGEVVYQKLQPCYQKVRNQHQQALLRAQQEQKKVTLSDIADGISIEDDEAGPETVISNENVGQGDAAFTEGGQDFSPAYDHLAEYILRSRRVIEDECLVEWGGDRTMFRRCVSSETSAVERLKARSVGLLPPDVFIGIRNECRGKWPRDYSKRNTCEVEEIRYYESVERKTKDPDFSFSVLQNIKETCSANWPNDYRMQERCMEEMMEEMRYSPQQEK